MSIIEIRDFSAPELDDYARLTERQLLHPEDNSAARFIAESPNVIERALDAGFIPVHLGPSRLRTETAAITAVEAVYLTLGLGSPAYDSETAGRISKSAVPGK